METRPLTRRAFVGAGLAGGAALVGGRLPSLAAAADKPWIEASIPELQAMMACRQLTSRELTLGYLRRIRRLNPLLGAVIATNPDAMAIAARRDHERRRGRVRGPLHGIPVILKDNIATADRMPTTSGSLALLHSRVPGDAPIVAGLRAAGAVLLGKANLSEWANFRGFGSINGWSARGGFTRDPYLLSFDPCGSSTGSAVAPAANLCAAAVGTETDGSVVCPAGNNLIVGLKPTLGLLAQDGIIPIAHSQDTAGPMGRTVTDVAILLGAMQTPFGPVAGHPVPSDYASLLARGALRGARIGIDDRYFTPDYGGEPDLVAVAQEGITVMRRLGATTVNIETLDPNQFYDAEFAVLLAEFKVDVARYLAGLRHTRMRTLADLIAFNASHCRAEMKYFGQELFELSEATSGDLTDPEYRSARELSLSLARRAIDEALAAYRLDAIIAPTYSFASSQAAIAGYPNISIPLGLTREGKPAGIWMYSTFLQETKLLRYAYDLEQEVQPRRRPEYLGTVPPEPPDAGICAALPEQRALTRSARLPYHLGTGKPLAQGY